MDLVGLDFDVDGAPIDCTEVEGTAGVGWPLESVAVTADDAAVEVSVDATVRRRSS